MRWIKNYKRPPQVGDVKVKKFFAVFPVGIDGEIRWLETVKIRYRLYYYTDGKSTCWVKEKFVN